MALLIRAPEGLEPPRTARCSARVYHCFDRIVIHGYLSGLSRPEQVVHFVRHVLDIPVVSKEVLRQRTENYRNWVEAYARNQHIPIEWAEKGLRKEDYVLPALHRMERRNAFGVYFIFRSMEQGRTFRITVPKFPTQDPNHRILAVQRSRFPHYYFYLRDEVLGPIVVRVAGFFPFHATQNRGSFRLNDRFHNQLPTAVSNCDRNRCLMNVHPDVLLAIHTHGPFHQHRAYRYPRWRRGALL